MSVDRAPLDGRAAAYLAILDVLRGQGFAAERLRELRTQGRLSGRDSGLATNIALGAVRHMITIEQVLSTVARFDKRRIRAQLRAILYAAAYQIIWMDRVPAFATVDEAVKLAARYVGGRSRGMVNAILRNLTRTIKAHSETWQRLDPSQIRTSWDQACVFTRPILPAADQSQAHLSAATSEHPARYETLVRHHGSEQAEEIAWASQAVPVIVLHRNELRIEADDFRTQMHAVFGDETELSDDVAFVPAATRVIDSEPFRKGLVFVQDPTAHAAAMLMAARPGERILDLCAAPGGKSIVLAQQMQDRGEVIACDVDEVRLARVRENAARLGLTCIHTSPLPSGVKVASLGLFDAAFLDVPCSNTGVIARRPEARLGLTTEKVESLVRIQKDLIQTATHQVRPGGRLIYSTCSLEPTENQELVEWFLTEQPDWHLETQQTTLPAWGPHLSDWRDGGYAALLVKSKK